MDEIDRANEIAEIMLSAAINNVRPRLKVTGKCYSCGEGLMDSIIKGSLFCDEFCRDDYEKQERMKAINGRK